MNKYYFVLIILVIETNDINTQEKYLVINVKVDEMVTKFYYYEEGRARQN